MRRATLLAVGLAAAAGLVACGTSEPSPAAAPSELEGRIVEVREESGAVRSFVLESGDRTYELVIDPEVEYGFDLAHLHEHEESGDPVVCRVEERDGALYALAIHDA